MIKFKLIEDWYVDDFFEKVKIYEAGHIFSPSIEGNMEGKYIIENPLNNGRMVMDFDQMLNAKSGDGKMFETIDENEIELVVEEIPEDKDLEVKKWRIQLDVTTSLRNLKKIEAFIKENISQYI
jgi:hypothetical protein